MIIPENLFFGTNLKVEQNIFKVLNFLKSKKYQLEATKYKFFDVAPWHYMAMDERKKNALEILRKEFHAHIALIAARRV